jgi:hypothetical protein
MIHRATPENKSLVIKLRKDKGKIYANHFTHLTQRKHPHSVENNSKKGDYASASLI